VRQLASRQSTGLDGGACRAVQLGGVCAVVELAAAGQFGDDLQPDPIGLAATGSAPSGRAVAPTATVPVNRARRVNPSPKNWET
jgi:hypothetical protein